jgi:hypothetical protein
MKKLFFVVATLLFVVGFGMSCGDSDTANNEQYQSSSQPIMERRGDDDRCFVVDGCLVPCGPNSYYICHHVNPNDTKDLLQMCVGVRALQGHMYHGDYLSLCSEER